MTEHGTGGGTSVPAPARTAWDGRKGLLAHVSLSAKLVASIIVLLSVGTVCISLAITQLVNNYMTQRTDNQLLQQADLVFRNTTLLNSKANPTNPMISYYVQAYDAHTGTSTILLQPVYKDGVVSRPDLPTDGSLDGHELAKPYTTPAIVDTSNTTRTPDHATMTMAEYPWRVVALRWISEDANGIQHNRGIIYIGLSLGNQSDMIDNLTKFCVMVSIAVVMLGGVVSALLVQRTLEPLKRIEKTAAKIASGDLSQRIPSAPEGTEIGSLSRSLNLMLAQIERSFRQQQTTTDKMKRFVSDASHELRTPLAAIHGYAELYKMQRGAGDGEHALELADDSIDHIEASSARMTVLVEDLLSLARLDEGRGISITQHVDFGAVIADSASDLHALDPQREIRTGVIGLDFDDPIHPKFTMTAGALPKVTLVADGARLQQVVTNIVGNIHRYTPQDSPVELALGVIGASMGADELTQLPPDDDSIAHVLHAALMYTKTNHGAAFAVARFVDHGPGVPAESRSRIFERFYTADPSRARLKGGTGLGMAIAQSVVNAHHGFICATESEGGGLTLTIILPLTPNGEAHEGAHADLEPAAVANPAAVADPTDHAKDGRKTERKADRRGGRTKP
ncbi:HAMP domain-containing sensor histidine kinase [uncultured Bifidobacterium sp.]|uniref:sensor histidine kinase n=1 Tax=uncultured Bifidobacterium sp. TaxID=165187 RepID=UPI0025899BA8|nr:HAMP domain-containing sensor histidine kinase [uncultured Bifidobacterium sp.]MEE0654636.1 HAMP domain-containing sensor histidine kinase [Bifidobacterium criceti]